VFSHVITHHDRPYDSTSPVNDLVELVVQGPDVPNGHGIDMIPGHYTNTEFIISGAQFSVASKSDSLLLSSSIQSGVVTGMAIFGKFTWMKMSLSSESNLVLAYKLE